MADVTFTKQDMDYLESTDIDSGKLYVEIKRLNEKVDNLNDKIEPKTDEDRKKEILSIRSKTDRLKAIEDNIDLWR